MTAHQLHDVSIPYLERLRKELIDAHPVTQARVRRRRVGVGILAVVLAVATFGTLTVFRSTPASAAVIISHDGDAIVVRIMGGRANASEVLNALRDAGVAARVSAVATGPSGVDRFVGLQTKGVSSLGARRGSAFTVARFPAIAAGETTVKVGQAARAGELYQAPTDAYQPGEPLACLPLSGKSAPEVVTTFAARGIDVTWFDPAKRLVSAPNLGTYVGTASATSAHRVLIYLTSTPSPQPLPADCS